MTGSACGTETGAVAFSVAASDVCPHCALVAVVVPAVAGAGVEGLTAVDGAGAMEAPAFGVAAGGGTEAAPVFDSVRVAEPAVEGLPDAFVGVATTVPRADPPPVEREDEPAFRAAAAIALAATGGVTDTDGAGAGVGLAFGTVRPAAGGGARTVAAASSAAECLESRNGFLPAASVPVLEPVGSDGCAVAIEGSTCKGGGPRRASLISSVHSKPHMQDVNSHFSNCSCRCLLLKLT